MHMSSSDVYFQEILVVWPDLETEASWIKKTDTDKVCNVNINELFEHLTCKSIIDFFKSVNLCGKL